MATEKRYKDLFFGVDLTKGFYFSYTYDLTHTVQHNMVPNNHVSAHKSCWIGESFMNAFETFLFSSKHSNHSLTNKTKTTTKT